MPAQISLPLISLPFEALHTLYGRILGRYTLRLDADGVTVWFCDRQNPPARDIECVANPANPDETLWVHSYPDAPFSAIHYGAAAQLWRRSYLRVAPRVSCGELLRTAETRGAA